MQNLTFLLMFALLLTGCGNTQTKFESEAAFREYLDDASNGFISEQEKDDLKFETKLTPLNNLNDDQVTVQLRVSRLDGKPVLTTGGQASKQEALEREGYLSFELSKDVWLESGDSIYPCAFHHYERNYNLKPSIDIFFRFNAFSPSDDVYFVYRDELFGQGLVKIKYSKDQFINCHVN